MMTISLEEAHEAGHALLAHLAGAEVLGAVADSCLGRGYTRLKPLPEDDDADRKLFAQALHIMSGLAAQHLAGYGKAHDYRAGADREELKAWWHASTGMKRLECFSGAQQFEAYMTHTSEQILRTHEEAFTAICDRFKAYGSISQADLTMIVPAQSKWLQPGRDDWWKTFLSCLRGSSDALLLQEQVEAAARQQQRQHAEYQRRLDALRSRHAEPERTTFHRPRVESIMGG
jgi:hypothetical protein